jgi:hypothetical protein
MEGIPTTYVGALKRNIEGLDNFGVYQVFLIKKIYGFLFPFCPTSLKSYVVFGGFHSKRLGVVGGIAMLD